MKYEDDELLTFGEILLKIYEGGEVARKAWVDSDTKDVIYAHVPDGGKSKVYMRYNDGTEGPWLPRQKEIFANDWYIIRYRR